MIPVSHPMVLHSAVARVVLVLLMAHQAAEEAKGVAEAAVDAAAEMVVEVVAADAGVMVAVETEAGDAHALTHFRYSTGPGAA